MLVPVVRELMGLAVNRQSGQGHAQGQQGSGAGLGSAGAAASQPMAGAGNNVSAMSGPNGQIAVDPVRNVIVFQGDPQRWRAIQGVLARLEQPARQVVHEVTVAEVPLTDQRTEERRGGEGGVNKC